MLTDEEIISIRNNCSSDRSTIDTIEYAKAIERAVLAKAMTKQEPAAEGEYKVHEWWRVEVKLYDGMLLAIEPEMLAGKSDLTRRDEETIRAAGRHLLAFIGEPQPAQAAAIPEDIAKKIWSHGYSRGHNDGIGCGHDLAPRCRHDGDDEAVDFLDDVISMLSASPKPDKS